MCRSFSSHGYFSDLRTTLAVQPPLHQGNKRPFGPTFLRILTVMVLSRAPSLSIYNTSSSGSSTISSIRVVAKPSTPNTHTALPSLLGHSSTAPGTRERYVVLVFRLNLVQLLNEYVNCAARAKRVEVHPLSTARHVLCHQRRKWDGRSTNQGFRPRFFQPRCADIEPGGPQRLVGPHESVPATRQAPCSTPVPAPSQSRNDSGVISQPLSRRCYPQYSSAQAAIQLLDHPGEWHPCRLDRGL